MAIRFDGRVAVVTGAGNGLGRQYALLLASRGAKVVVNDLGGSFDGTGEGSRAADKVVAEIQAAGGEAVANYNSVVDGSKVVQTALDTWGRIDIVVNNAGILRDVSFHKMTQKDWDLIYQVHLLGTMAVSKAAYAVMREQKYGRIVNVASSAGIYGNFGQCNYSAMKLGILGFTFSLAREGQKRNILVNCIAPVAASRMTATVMPPEVLEKLKPEYVAPVVAFLASEQNETTGGIFETGAGWVSKLRWQRSQGAGLDVVKGFGPDEVAAAFDEICDFDEDPENPTSTNDAFSPMMTNLSKL